MPLLMVDIADLSVKATESLEDERMEKNVWNVTHQLVDRLDGAPCFIRIY